MLLRLSYLALTGMVTFLPLLATSNADKDIEILVLRLYRSRTSRGGALVHSPLETKNISLVKRIRPS